MKLLKKNKNFKLKTTGLKTTGLKTREKQQSQRQLKVSQEIQSSLSECLLRGGKLDPRLINYPLSITKVTISPDLKVANCFYLPFNTDLSNEDIQDALEKSKYYIRDYITKKINLKYSPEIRFFFDSAYEDVNMIEYLKNQVI